MFTHINVVAIISMCIPLRVPLTLPAKTLHQFGELTSRLAATRALGLTPTFHFILLKQYQFSHTRPQMQAIHTHLRCDNSSQSGLYNYE